MPTLIQVRDRVNTWLATNFPALVTRQETFFANNGRYFQGLLTHNVPVDHGADSDLEFGDTAPTETARTPSDFNVSWANYLPALVNLPFPAALRVDVYENTDGWGWSASVFIRINGTIYTRTQNGAGTETNRTQGWSIYDPDPLA